MWTFSWRNWLCLYDCYNRVDAWQMRGRRDLMSGERRKQKSAWAFSSRKIMIPSLWFYLRSYWHPILISPYTLNKEDALSLRRPVLDIRYMKATSSVLSFLSFFLSYLFIQTPFFRSALSLFTGVRRCRWMTIEYSTNTKEGRWEKIAFERRKNILLWPF